MDGSKTTGCFESSVALIVGVLTLAPVTGCGGNNSSNGDDTATDGDATDVTGDFTDTGDDTTDPDAPLDGDGPVTFSVSGVDPDDGDTAVFLDQTIVITFDAAVDEDTVGDTSVTVSAGSTQIDGRILVDDRMVMFVPSEFVASTEYTLTVDDGVTSTAGVALPEAFSSTFTTATTYTDGTEPTDDDLDLFVDEDYIFLVRQVEYVLLGTDYDDSGLNEFVVDPIELDPRDPAPTTEVVFSQADIDVGSTRGKVAAAGNLDDDPFDEVAFVSFPLASGGSGTLSLMDTDGTTVTVSDITLDLSIGSAGHQYRYDVAMGNVDDDPPDEILIVGIDVPDRNGKLWVVDDTASSHALLATMDILGDFTGSTWDGFDVVKIAAGDLDADANDEIVVGFVTPGEDDWSFRVVTDIFVAYDTLAAHPARHHSASGSGSQDFEIDTGDVDGDGLDEIVFGSQFVGLSGPSCRREYEITVIDDLQESLVELVNRPTNGPSLFPGLCDGLIPTELFLGALDVDDDGLDEIAIQGSILEWTAPDSFQWISDVLYLGAMASGEGFVSSADVGDVDGDGAGDIILLLDDATIRAWGYDIIPQFDPTTGDPIDPLLTWAMKDERSHVGATGHDNEILVGANLDTDSVIVEPSRVDGPGGDPIIEHEVVFSNDRIIAVLAAAPCGEGIGQNTDACSTAFGTSSSGSTTLGATLGAHVGASVGAEVEVGAGVGVTTTIFSFEFEVSVELEVTGSVSHTHTTTHSVTDIAGYGEDLVLFSTIPYDRYYYTVVTHHDADQEGMRIYTNFPRSPRFFVVSREFYNANNGDQPDIDGDILTHTPTDLSTYPSHEDALDILDDHLLLGISGEELVNQGTGLKEIGIVISDEWTVGSEVVLSVGADLQICTSGVCFGLSFGVSAGVFAEYNTSTETAFTCSVGALDEEHFMDNQYNYGMFAYIDEMTNSGGDVTQQFFVLNHWVD